MPRGLRDEVAALVSAAGGSVKLIGAHDPPAPLHARFTGELRTVQAEAVAAMAAHPTWVLVAPPGTGKTVMACTLIAHHRLPTAVIVNRGEVLAQWRERLAEFFALPDASFGSSGAGKNCRGGAVDLIMLQSLSIGTRPTGSWTTRG
jgi:superfamily II DNA or RNA helicase